MICAYTIVVIIFEMRSPLRRPKCRRKNNFKMDLKETGYDGVNGIQLAQDRD